MSEMSVAILIPVLGRPARVAPLLESIKVATPQDHTILFICDPDDHDEIAAIQAAGEQMICPGGSYAQKINAGYRATTDPLVFMAADDLDFRPDWLPRAMSYLKPGIEVVGTNDICNPRVMCGEHSTHTLVTRSYVEEQSGVIDQPGLVLHEGYAHDWVDDEFVQTAMARGVYAHAFDSIVEHLHPLAGKAADDATYRRGRAQSRAGRRLFHTRRRLWLAEASRGNA